jgi:hypothetical protein
MGGRDVRYLRSLLNMVKFQSTLPTWGETAKITKIDIEKTIILVFYTN